MVSSIIAWGDSILKGVVSGGDSKRFDITENDSLSQACKSLGIELTNKSVFGSWMTKTRRTQDRSLRNGVTAQVAIIESGTNDCDYDWAQVSVNPDAEHLQRCPLEEFRKLLKEAVDVSRQNKITPLFMTLTPLVSDCWFNNICIGNDKDAILKFIGGDIHLLYRNQELFSLEAEKIARELGVQIVDIRSEFLQLKNYRDYMCLDGVHPNQKGYDFMAKIWEREIPKLKLEF
ncbi:MAG: SGNH/GDSL hydrolase family protein [Treponema sp.]|nr:SGNH/GDSL hydrolase family protein [Treponema sp.]